MTLNSPIPRTIRLDDDTLDDGVPLQERYERFCGHMVESGGNMSQSLRLAFCVDKRATAQHIHHWARTLLKDPAIARRLQDMRDDAVNQTMFTVREIIQDLHDIATADPNELVSNVHDCCRFCHGVGHRYQWVDVAEYAKACDDALKRSQQMPDMDGGEGFHPENDPNMTCPACFGQGVPRVVIHDTRKVSAKARKLYAGMKKGDVVMHDQLKARDQLLHIMGAFKDGIPLTPTAPNAQPISAEMQEQDAGRVYLQLIQGGKG